MAVWYAARSVFYSRTHLFQNMPGLGKVMNRIPTRRQ